MAVFISGGVKLGGEDETWESSREEKEAERVAAAR